MQKCITKLDTLLNIWLSHVRDSDAPHRMCLSIVCLKEGWHFCIGAFSGCTRMSGRCPAVVP